MAQSVSYQIAAKGISDEVIREICATSKHRYAAMRKVNETYGFDFKHFISWNNYCDKIGAAMGGDSMGNCSNGGESLLDQAINTITGLKRKLAEARTINEEQRRRIEILESKLENKDQTKVNILRNLINDETSESLPDLDYDFSDDILGIKEMV